MEKIPMTPEKTERNKELFAYEMTAVRGMLEEEMQRTDNISVPLCEQLTDNTQKRRAVFKGSLRKVILTAKSVSTAGKSVRLKDASPKEVTLTTKAAPISGKSVRLKDASPKEVTLTTKAAPISGKSVQLKDASPKEVTLTTQFIPVKGKTAQWKAPQKIVELTAKTVPTGKSVELKGTTPEPVTLTVKTVPTTGKMLQPFDYQYNGKISLDFVPPRTDEIIGEMKIIQQKAQESAQKRNTAIQEIINMEIQAPDISADIAHILDSMQKEMTGVKHSPPT